MIIPIATIAVALVDFAICSVIFAIMMIWYSHVPPWRIVLVPAFAALAFFASLGPGLWVTALNVKYRDFRYVIPFLVQFGLYLSPVGFSSSVIPDTWRLAFSLNPMVGIIDGFRWCVISDATIYTPGFLISILATAVLLLCGIRQFRRLESRFADII